MVATSSQKNDSGFALLVTIIVTALIFSLGAFYISFSVTDARVSQSQENALVAYYLTEAGVTDALWNIENNATWTSNFLNNPGWQTTVSRVSAFYPNGSYDILFDVTAPSRATVTITGKIALAGGRFAKRVVKVDVSQATGQEPPEERTVFNSGRVKIYGSAITIAGGGMFSNTNINLKHYSTVTVDDSISAVNQITIHPTVTTVAPNGIREGAPSFQTPAVSFNGGPDSLRSQAAVIYDADDFKKMLEDNPTLTLNGIHYVEGKIEIGRGHNLTINGALVAKDDIIIGTGDASTAAQITINYVPGEPAGIFSQDDIKIKSDNNKASPVLNINGILYASDDIKISRGENSTPMTLNVTGAIVAQDGLDIQNVPTGILIVRDDNIVNAALGINPAPIVAIDHWEEQY